MKKIVLTMVALLSLTMAQAQNENGERKAPKKMDPQEMVDRMAKDLNLTADQKTKVAEVMNCILLLIYPRLETISSMQVQVRIKTCI